MAIPKKRCDNCGTIIARTERVCPACQFELPQLLTPAEAVAQVPSAQAQIGPQESPLDSLTQLPKGMSATDALDAAVRTMAMQIEYMVAQLKIISDVIELIKKGQTHAAGSASGSQAQAGGATGMAEPKGVSTPESGVARDPRDQVS